MVWGSQLFSNDLFFYHYGMIILGKTYHGRTECAAKEYQASIFGGKFSDCLKTYFKTLSGL